jgi:hypothetical protein
MSQVKPGEVLNMVAEAIPRDCRENMVIIRSLAASYAFFGDDDTMTVQTKDVDCMLCPFQFSVEKGKAIMKQLRKNGWRPPVEGPFAQPGNADTVDNDLPAVRLYPPGMVQGSPDAWFIELLSAPESTGDRTKRWIRLDMEDGHYGLPLFPYFALTAFDAVKIEELGIYRARPCMMALANLLEHPEIGPETIGDTNIKRSNKDLGRVLAIGFLTEIKGLDPRDWVREWILALSTCFPDEWKQLARNAGSGLSELLHSRYDLEQAHYTCINGLLSSFRGTTIEELKEAGERILGDVIEPLLERIEEVP